MWGLGCRFQRLEAKAMARAFQSLRPVLSGLALLTAVAVVGWAQAGRDELDGRLSGLTGGRRVAVLNELAAELVERDPDLVERLCLEALELAGSLGDRNAEAAAYFELGNAHRVRGNHRAALDAFSQARRLYTNLGDRYEIGRCVRRLGDVHYFISDYDRSLQYYLAALEIFIDLSETGAHAKAPLHVGHLFTTIGNVLRKAEDLDEALAYYGRSLDQYHREGSDIGQRGALYNIANVLFDKGLLEDARYEFLQVLEQARGAGDSYLVSLALAALGGIELKQNRLADAETYTLEALELNRRLGRKQGVLANLIRLAEVSRRQELPARGLRLAEESARLAEELEDRSAQAEVAAEQANLYETLGDHRQALASLRKHQGLREEILTEKRVRQLDELRLRFEVSSREHEISILKREKAFQRTMFLVAGTGLLLALALLLLVIRSSRLKARISREIAAKNEQLSLAYARVEELSRTDDLTGLANRRAMMERLRHEQQRSQRSGLPYGLLLADLDDFKQWNDRFGHGCGDALLIAVAGRLRAAVRQQDLVARWGGEEFLILLPETNVSGAEKVAEKVRTLIVADSFPCAEEPISLTVSVGVSRGGGVSFDEALSLADKALYESKRGGKNRVSVANSV